MFKATLRNRGYPIRRRVDTVAAMYEAGVRAPRARSYPAHDDLRMLWDLCFGPD